MLLWRFCSTYFYLAFLNSPSTVAVSNMERAMLRTRHGLLKMFYHSGEG